jgi:hypothetical protein
VTATETKIAGYFAEHPPATAKLGKALRARLRARLPGLFEVVYVYERQKSLVIAYSPTEQGYEGVCSLALDPAGAKLHFGQGASLSKADPSRLLQGKGKTVRHVVLHSVADLDRPEIEGLISAALNLAKVRPDAASTSAVVIRAESQAQRARRATKTTRPASARGSSKPRR